MTTEQLGRKIKIARVEAGLTQAELAQATRTLQKNISRYETGAAIPSIETLMKIAKALKKSPSDFLE